MTAIILDTETHALNGNAIEIAWFEFGFSEDGKPFYNTKRGDNQRFNPGEPIDFGAMAAHHILDSDVADKPLHTTFKMPRIDERPVQYIIGHNIDYDIAVLNRCGVNTTDPKTICTLALSRMVWPDATHNLSALTYMLAEDKEKARETLKSAHSAWQDILITGSLLKRIIALTAVKSLKDLYLLSERARIPTVISFGKHKGTPIAELPPSYVAWLLGQPELDPYLKKALS